MQIKSALLMVALAPFLLGNDGCSQDNVPPPEQLEFYLPADFRSCPYAPNSPGAGASELAKAKYIQGLYFAWKRCYDNNQAVDDLYNKYRVRLQEIIARGES